MYKRYLRKSPEILIMEWDGKDETIEAINSMFCIKVEGSSVFRSSDTNTLILQFKNIIGCFKTFHHIGDSILLDEFNVIPYKRLTGMIKEDVKSNFTICAFDSIPDELTKEKIQSMPHHLNVGNLKKFIEKYKIADNSPVLIQRVHDTYFTQHHWGTYLKNSEHTDHLIKRNEEIKSGEGPLRHFFLNDEELKLSMSQYHPAWSCVHYKDDADMLFIDLFY